MLGSELLIERRLQRTKIMYHGTSSVFLSSIMKHGLIPNAPHKSFGAHDIKLYSYGGVYLTSNENRAEEAAFDAIKYHNGEPIIIKIQYVTGSGGLDEDLINLTFKSKIPYFLRDTDNLSSSSFMSTLLPYFINSYSRYLNKPTYKTIELIHEYLKIAYQLLVNDKNWLQKIELLKYYHEDYDKITDTARKNYRQILTDMGDYLITNTRLKQIVKAIMNSVKDNTRSDEMVQVPRSIKFKGKTRIIQIYNLKTRKILYTENSN